MAKTPCFAPFLLATAAGAAFLAPPAGAAVVPAVSAGTLNVTGDGAADQITLRLAPGAPGVVQVDAGGTVSAFDRAAFDAIAIRSGGGADTVRIDDANGAFTHAEATTIESGAGADTVAGGAGAETIAAGEDGDLVAGAGGADQLLLGGGDDTVVQHAGDGADVVDGQGGADALRAHGSAAGEELTVQGFDGRVLMHRDTGDAALDMRGVEQAEVDAGRGPDLIDIGDVQGTGLERLEARAGLADGAADSIAAAGTPDLEIGAIAAAGEDVHVGALPYELVVADTTTADRLTFHGMGDRDLIDVRADAAARVTVTLDGGDGEDVLTGHAAIIRAGGGDDYAAPDGAQATVDLGDGSDTVSWAQTHGDRTVDGGPGVDAVTAYGRSVDDVLAIAPAGGRAVVTRNQLDLLDLGGVESVQLAAGTGADRIVAADLAGTGVTDVIADPGGADARVDTIAVDGTAAADLLDVVSNAAATLPTHTLTGLAAKLRIDRTEPGDRFELRTHGGDDQANLQQMSKDKLQPFLEGGAGKDLLVGSPGQDVIAGGTGNDVAILRDGLDTFTWAAGDGADIVEGGLGTDFLRMNGSAASEQYDVSPAGVRVRATVSSGGDVDTGQLERIDILPARGQDQAHVHDLTGTAVTNVDFDLAPQRGTTATDQEADFVVVEATNGNDVLSAEAGGQSVWVKRPGALAQVHRSDPTLDTLHVDTKLGADTLTVAPAVHQRLRFTSK